MLTGADTIEEGSEYTLTLGAVTDLGDDMVTEYLVDWGDGAQDTFTTGGDVTHTYADGEITPTITVDLTDEDGTHPAAGQKSITVSNVAPTIVLTGADTITEGSEYTLTLDAVTDPGDDTVTAYIVSWGDSAQETFTAGGDVTHTYADGDNTPVISVDLVDEDGTHTAVQDGDVASERRDHWPRKGEVLVRHGKGMKERNIPLGRQVRGALEAYLSVRPPTVSDRLFVSRTYNTLSERDIQRMVQNVAYRAGIRQKVTPHLLRHTFATRALRGGVDIATLSRLLGHETLATTARYLHPDKESVAAMVEEL